MAKKWLKAKFKGSIKFKNLPKTNPFPWLLVRVDRQTTRLGDYNKINLLFHFIAQTLST